jgi:inner membrane protein
VQYLLVSCALVIFYTLLLAISEHLSFGLSYLISAFATTTLISAYSTTMFRSIKQAGMMGLFLTGLYAYLYIVLLQENLSLLFGAVGLFIALAIVMFVLRKVNWYKSEDDVNIQDSGHTNNNFPGYTAENKEDIPPVYIPKNDKTGNVN